MIRTYFTWLGIFGLLASSAVLAEGTFTEPEDIAARFGIGDFAVGKTKSASCRECHSEDGKSFRAPFLTGQYAGYLAKQLGDFRAGERKHPAIKPSLDTLTETDINDLATYFAGGKVQPDKAIKTGNANILAQDLFVRGDLKRNILPCKSCHGIDGQGSHSANDIYPTIAGQHKQYLQEQLANWRSGTRVNSPSQVMNVIAKSLSDAEIAALAEYVSDMQ